MSCNTPALVCLGSRPSAFEIASTSWPALTRRPHAAAAMAISASIPVPPGLLASTNAPRIVWLVLLGATMDVSVLAAVAAGLVASFIQSVGLTLQRKSHLLNGRLLPSQQRPASRRPLWVAGFATFMLANIAGTVFQIGALPIVMLAPLGAVSLLYNALLARILLDDLLSLPMVLGSTLIAIGAATVGYFGAVPSPPHTLPQLLELYTRPPFVALAVLLTLGVIGALLTAHLVEWKMNHPFPRRQRRKRRTPHPDRLSTLAEVNESPSGITTPILTVADEAVRRGLPTDRLVAAARAEGLLPPHSSRSFTPPGYGRQYRSALAALRQKVPASRAPTPSQSRYGAIRPDESGLGLLAVRRAQRSCLLLGILYAGASGTLSGACLLLAKTGVELLVVSLDRENQFQFYQTWALLLTLGACALLQLWYLNKALRWTDPTIVCPLAFCFYNSTSILMGLVYFDQADVLTSSEARMILLGTLLLLIGVWLISAHKQSVEEAIVLNLDLDPEEAAVLLSSPDSSPRSGRADLPPLDTRPNALHPALDQPDTQPLQVSIEPYVGSRPPAAQVQATQPYVNFWDGGFSIGLSPSSPGFQFARHRRDLKPYLPCPPSPQQDSPTFFLDRSPTAEPGEMQPSAAHDRHPATVSEPAGHQNMPERRGVLDPLEQLPSDVPGPPSEEAASSAFGLTLPRVEPSALRAALRQATPPWWSKLLSWRSASSHHDRERSFQTTPTQSTCGGQREERQLIEACP